MAGEAFQEYARAALAQRGIEVDDVDLAVMSAAEGVYGPERDALLAADLSGTPYEHDFDPSRPPSDAGGAG
jgi:predicted naringenin-chalcone synthase